jgi:hypothetical protein
MMRIYIDESGNFIVGALGAARAAPAASPHLRCLGQHDVVVVATAFDVGYQSVVNVPNSGRAGVNIRAGHQPFETSAFRCSISVGDEEIARTPDPIILARWFGSDFSC